ncbi:MAG TPA: sigma-70 family RNA polymerase sigma factor [Kofleriaceae bacterium]|nr:sigma-70 family RNA polymerase sigma factor [Kofleriaceae bacterium]
MTIASSEPSDDELVRRSLAGEGRAFALLVAKHQRLVYAVALSNARDAAHAEDVAQQAFVEAWHDLPRLRDPARLSAWLAGIARNVARTWKRHAVRRRRREIAASTPAVATGPTPLDHVLERETALLLRDALAEIPSAYREVLVLFYCHGQSVAQVATALEVSEELVKQRLSRGRRALRASLETQVEDGLAQLGPGARFATTVMVAVAASSARKASAASLAGKVLFVGKTAKLTVAAVVRALALGLVWYRRTSRDTARAPVRTESAATPRVPAAAGAPAPARRAPTTRTLATRQDYATLVQAIRTAREQRTAKPPRSADNGSAPSLGPPAPASLDRTADDDPDEDYVRDAVTGLLPMIRDCYQQARERQPDVAGTLVVHFVIEGEPGIGGVVTESSLDREKSDMKDAELARCIEQTMYALEIDPPLEGTTADVTFPFTFPAKH